MRERLHHRVSIQNYTTSTGPYSTKTWAETSVKYGYVNKLSGKELIHAQQLKSEATYMVVIRYTTDVTTKSRIVFGQKILEVVDVHNEEERNEKLTLLCKEVL